MKTKHGLMNILFIYIYIEGGALINFTYLDTNYNMQDIREKKDIIGDTSIKNIYKVIINF